MGTSETKPLYEHYYVYVFTRYYEPSGPVDVPSVPPTNPEDSHDEAR